MRISQSLAFPTEANERRYDRQSARLSARVRELGGPGAAGQIHDVSLGGCRLGGVDLPQDAEVWVSIGTAPPRRARIVWSRAGQAGCAFYAPLTRAELRNVVLNRG